MLGPSQPLNEPLAPDAANNRSVIHVFNSYSNSTKIINKYGQHSTIINYNYKIGTSINIQQQAA